MADFAEGNRPGPLTNHSWPAVSGTAAPLPWGSSHPRVQPIAAGMHLLPRAAGVI
jgi:hypothetical protein